MFAGQKLGVAKQRVQRCPQIMDGRVEVHLLIGTPRHPNPLWSHTGRGPLKFAFGLQPVVEIMAGLSPAAQKQFKRSLGDVV
jgi:hypothetical protein